MTRRVAHGRSSERSRSGPRPAPVVDGLGGRARCDRATAPHQRQRREAERDRGHRDRCDPARPGRARSDGGRSAPAGSGPHDPSDDPEPQADDATDERTGRGRSFAPVCPRRDRQRSACPLRVVWGEPEGSPAGPERGRDLDRFARGALGSRRGAVRRLGGGDARHRTTARCARDRAPALRPGRGRRRAGDSGSGPAVIKCMHWKDVDEHRARRRQRPRRARPSRPTGSCTAATRAAAARSSRAPSQMSGATCSNLSMSGEAQFEWADGGHSTASLSFTPQPSEPKKIFVSGTVTPARSRG